MLKVNASDAFAAAVRERASAQGRGDIVSGPYGNLAEAVSAARAAAEPGDVVLLSPGFTSFGMFLNEFDRGDQFRAVVTELK